MPCHNQSSSPHSTTSRRHPISPVIIMPYHNQSSSSHSTTSRRHPISPVIIMPCHNQSSSPHSTTSHRHPISPVIVMPFHNQSSSCRLTTSHRYAVLQPLVAMPCHNQCTDTSLESPKVSHSYLTLCNCVSECKWVIVPSAMAITKPHISYAVYCFKTDKCHRMYPNPDFTRTVKVATCRSITHKCKTKCGNEVRSVLLCNPCIISRPENYVLSCASVSVAQYQRKSSFFDFYIAG